MRRDFIGIEGKMCDLKEERLVSVLRRKTQSSKANQRTFESEWTRAPSSWQRRVKKNEMRNGREHCKLIQSMRVNVWRVENCSA